MNDSSEAKRTPLYQAHLEAGAKMVDFAGWTMPVQYSGVIEEHRAVRQAAGLFDVSHMGQIRVTGASAESFLQSVTPNDVSRLTRGRAHYSGLLTEAGTYIDDLLVYRLGDEDFLLVVNAANADKDFDWLRSRSAGEVELEDVSEDWALLALQGPRAREILASLTPCDIDALKYYRFAVDAVAGGEAIISRTGYTGEDGFELYLQPDHAPAVWRQLLETGAPVGLRPAGLGARDTLRLEAGMALYGHEIDDTTTPFDAGLNWVVKMDKGEFVGRGALEAQQQQGSTRSLVGFEVQDRGIARQGHRVVAADEEIGWVTSGTWSPTFEKALGMAYVPRSATAIGTDLTLDVRGRSVAAKVVDLPFYKRN
ncbi:MAG: glycine cleavage system aminomethyltransferase GcvT [Acidobacteriota bacterium]